MLVNRLVLLLGWLVISMIPAAQPASAWETYTHQEVHGKAVTEGSVGLFLLDTYLKEQLQFKNGINETVNKMSVLDWIKEGAAREDDPKRWLNHFHRPLLTRDQAGLRYRPWFFLYLLQVEGKSSIDWALAAKGSQVEQGNYSWYDARAFYRQALTAPTRVEREAAYANVFRSVGQVMHLIEDAAVPEHVRNDGDHGPDAKLKGKPSIETWVDDNFGSIPLVPAKPLTPADLSTLLRLGEGGAPTRPLPLANLLDTDAYDGTTAAVTTQPVIGLAEFASANFFSNNTIFRTEFPHPSQAGLGQPFTKEGVQYRRKEFEGERVDYLVVAEGALGRYRYSLNSRCYENYAKELIPRAIQYAAAIPYYFFRGTLAVDAAEEVDASGVTQVSVYVRTLSPDDLGRGVFTLYYDDVDGTRKEVGAPIAVAGFTRTDPPLTLTFMPPATRANDTYTLVFQGILGMEEDAVIGTVFTPSAYTFTTIDAPYDYHTTLIRITNAGRILGGTYTYDLATGSFTPIPLDQEVFFYGMNDQGDLAGYAVTRHAPPETTVTYHGYLITAAGETLFDVQGMTSTIALDINNSKDAVGHCWIVSDPLQSPHEKAFLKKAGQSALPFLIEGSLYTYAYGINDAGQIVGEYGDATGNHGFLLREGALATVIPRSALETTIAPPGTIYTQPLDINAHGEIVGTYADASGQYGFLLSAGHYTRIRYPGAAHTWVLGINDAGAITGYYSDAARRYHGFVGVPKKKAVP